LYEVAPTQAIARPVCGATATAVTARTLSMPAPVSFAADGVAEEAVAEDAALLEPSLHATRVASSAHSMTRVKILSCMT
jgi:hypothetical protein